VSALAFLHADPTPTAPALSPLADAAAAAGARFELRDGWEIAASFAALEDELATCRETVGFADRSQLGVLELQGGAEALDAIPPLADGLARRAEEAWWCRVTPERALVVCEPGATAALRERLTGAFEGHLADVTASLAGLALAGPRARETFARFCALDLRPQSMPVGGFRPGSVARTPGYVLCEATDRYLMLFGAAYGDYVWEVVADAAGHLGGRPVGADALAALAGELPPAAAVDASSDA
jgi:heterotetrameric sarcosine oxidase gamma subunit